MPDENVDKVPFLLCIPARKRGNVIEKLSRYQKKHYHTELDLDLKTKLPEPPKPEIPVHEDREGELERMMRQAPSRRYDDDNDGGT